MPARLISAVGKDREGAYILETLSRGGVDIEPLISTEMPTPKTVVLVNAAGERAFLHRPGASRNAFSDGLTLTPEMAAGCTRFHLANLFALPGLRPHGADLLRQARALGLHTSADTGWDARGEWMQVFGPCLREIELLFVNEDEARQLTGESSAREAARALREHGPDCVVLKLGAAGCLVVTGAGDTVVPGFRVSVVDSTGAGDCFTGMFLAALQRGCTWEDAARFANAAGALNVQQLGATRGARSWDDTAEWMRAAGPAQ